MKKINFDLKNCSVEVAQTADNNFVSSVTVQEGIGKNDTTQTITQNFNDFYSALKACKLAEIVIDFLVDGEEIFIDEEEEYFDNLREVQNKKSACSHQTE